MITSNPPIIYELAKVENPPIGICQAYGCGEPADFLMHTHFEKVIILSTQVCHGHAQIIDDFLKEKLHAKLSEN